MCKRYAESAIRTAEFDKPEEHIEQGLEIRLQRQEEILNRETPPTMQVILDEPVLYRRAGSAKVMREQLFHLLELSKRPNIHPRVLPFSAGAHESPEPTFQHLTKQERATINWHISTYSDNGGATCVEAGALGDGTGRVAMRHSHHPEDTHLVYTRQEWEAFTQGVRAGEFNLHN